ncbi:MAG: HDIG domain-containing metalloprotein [Candidatus Bathyarchaeia archaeon]
MEVKDLISELHELIDLIEDVQLRHEVKDLLTNPHVEGCTERLSLAECPAGVFQHHSYAGGLVQHTVAVTRIALALCDLLEEVYGGGVDRDLVIAGSLIHDVMKTYAYTKDGEGGFRSSHIGEKMGHLTLLVAELYRRGLPMELIHVASSHHGEMSPVKPRTIEALIVSVADLTDSELNRRTLRAVEYLLRKSIGGKHRLRSSEEAIEVIQTKMRNGWEGLKRFENENLNSL